MMRRRVMGPSVMSAQHKMKLVDKLHNGELEQELQGAITYCKQRVGHQDWMLASGHAVATASPKEVLKKLTGHNVGDVYLPDEVKFGGTFGMLDLDDRAKPMSETDVGRMRWACEV